MTSRNLFLAVLLAVSMLFSIAACSDRNADEVANQGQGEELLLHVDSPDWEDQIIFFLMTDRYDDGDPSNNDLGAGEYDPQRELFYSGGDIQGVIDRLDYIEGLGATVVWPTPLVVNQWLSEETQLTGFSGYYAVDFSDIDPHLGDLSLYQSLSDKLHRRGMYLMKDIVVNHTGLFFTYDGAYDPNDTAKSFRLLESTDARQPAPSLPPFNMIDRNNPDHYEAGIYNWTPMIVDYQNLGPRQFTYQLGGLADINTSNPAVIEAFQDIYGDWIKKAGVDAFRIDTVRYVEPDFFAEFMYGEGGIAETAARTGRDNFLSFGEVLDYSKPFENTGEVELAKYLDNNGRRILPSVASFPLKQEIKSVLGQGKPTAQLAYRLEQHMQMFTNPYITPTFVDNHDVPRFLASGTDDAFKQAFALIFTIPGIPTIYQGSAQGFLETRQAMFEGGYLSDRDHFDTDNEMYRYIAGLSELRTNNRALRRGELEILGANDNGPGLLAFRRSDPSQTLDVIINSSDEPILVDNLELGQVEDSSITPIFSQNFEGRLTMKDGKLTAELPGRAFVVLEQQLSDVPPSTSDEASIDIAVDDAGATTFEKDFVVSGSTPGGSEEIWLLKNGLISTARMVPVDDGGRWSYTYPVRNLGEESFYLVAYDPATSVASQRVLINTRVDLPAYESTIPDPTGDDDGPTDTYVDMQQPNANGQKDLVGARVSVGGNVLKLELTLRSLTTDWLPPNGFDNVAFSIFLDDPDRALATELPDLDAAMPGELSWEFGHVAYGWGNTVFTPTAGESPGVARLSVAPRIDTSSENTTITFTYDGAAMGIDDWRGFNIYVTTWDISGEGAYVLVDEDPSDWAVGGAAPGSPKILDDLLVSVPLVSD